MLVEPIIFKKQLY